ncbi:MAG TPA: hypothetical protein VFM58_16085 [Solirubrobacteraceae bacterium]|nr:hypothetical protein [Solirubrobacteraceae bacterium]
MSRSRSLSPPAQLALDAALALWTIAWVWMGFAVAHEVRGIADLSDTVGSVGRAVTTVGGALRDLPLVGDQLAAPADELDRAGRDAVSSAVSARSSARRVGTLLGVSIALIPTLPLIAIYVPGRIAATRERRSLRRAVASGRSPALDELLARRALVHLPYHRLRRLSRDPLGDLRAGRHAALADAELEWHGIGRPRRRGARR